MTTPARSAGAAGLPTVRPAPRRAGSRRQPRLLFLLPAGMLLALLNIYPLVQLVRMSVSDVTATTLNTSWEFTGFDNLVAGFTSGQDSEALRRTLVFVVIVTGLGMVGGVTAAIALRTRGRWSGFLLALMVFV